VKVLRAISLAALVVVASGCQQPEANVNPGAGGAGFTIALPWDASTMHGQREILCAYKGLGIGVGAEVTTDWCGHHIDVVGSTQDGYALDFSMDGESVRSVDSGVVRWAQAYTGDKSWSCFGNSIAVDTLMSDGSVVTAFYAHLGSIKVSVGDKVTQGEEIATSGSSGGGTNSVCPKAYGAHLHFALYTNANYLTAAGAPVSAQALAIAGASIPGLLTSPPYDGSSRVPEPWINCTRKSTFTTAPAGEEASCSGLHAGDVLTKTS
jgi:murein DD-endopeptidase MepM/ murein hydrolase activator NlpD